MGSGLRRAEEPPIDWINFVIACRPRLAEALRDNMPDLYAYLGGEMGWSPTELDRHPLSDLVTWANARSRANERAHSG